MKNKKTAIEILASVAVTVMAVAFLAMPVGAACNTGVTASVDKIIDCSGGGTINVGTVQPGNAAAKTYTISATTNSVDGFSITSSAINNLSHSDEADTISYTSSAGAGTQGYKITPATYSEWKKSGGTAFTSDSIVETGSVWRHSAATGTETLTITVGTTAATVAGSYSGTVSWTCAAN
jgi:hypothetical protein